MEKEILQTTLRIRDKDMIKFLERKIKGLKEKGIKHVSYQSVIEALIAKWMKEDELK